MAQLRDTVRPALARWAERCALGVDEQAVLWRAFHLLTRESLDFDASAGAPRFSGICRDGAPWQFCSTLTGRGGHGVRFLTEVGAPGAPLRTRTVLTVERVAELLQCLGGHEGHGAVQALAAMTPDDDAHLAGLWVGFALLPRRGARLRLYANNGWGSEEQRWHRLVRAMQALRARSFGAQLVPRLADLVGSFSPAGFALTLPARTPTCKLYLRPFTDPWPAVRRLADDLLGAHAAPWLAAIEHAFERPLEHLPPRALVLSVSAPADRGALDMKLDLCGPLLFDERRPAALAVDRLARSLGVDGASAEAPCASETAFIGVGCDADGDCRVNVYHAPCGALQRVAEAA